jgi:hypothetical protein
MAKQKSQGGLASSSGNTLERTIMGTIESKNFEVEYYRNWKKNPSKYGSELLLRNVPYTTIYGHKGNTEFLLKSEQYDLEIRIECKWQQSSGSVDEKFPYLYLNCLERMPENKIIVVVDGGGAKAGAVTWLEDAAETMKYSNEVSSQKDLKVMNLTGFLTWSNKTFG